MKATAKGFLSYRDGCPIAEGPMHEAGSFRGPCCSARRMTKQLSQSRDRSAVDSAGAVCTGEPESCTSPRWLSRNSDRLSVSPLRQEFCSRKHRLQQMCHPALGLGSPHVRASLCPLSKTMHPLEESHGLVGISLRTTMSQHSETGGPRKPLTCGPGLPDPLWNKVPSEGTRQHY